MAMEVELPPGDTPKLARSRSVSMTDAIWFSRNISPVSVAIGCPIIGYVLEKEVSKVWVPTHLQDPTTALDVYVKVSSILSSLRGRISNAFKE